ncbi:MAG: MMPL family transporter, partial [Thermoplasmata archaeon]|nr:MMPL family transporter [Thermoplasmata archaeon]
IHITHRFLEDIKVHEDLKEASKSTMLNTGTALFGAASTTVAGFGLLVFALLPPLQQFGIVTALSILFSFIASVIVLPSLLIIWAKGYRRFGTMKDRANDTSPSTPADQG